MSEGQSDVKVSRDQFKDFIKKRGTIAKVALVETALPVSDWLRKDGRQTKIQLNELEASLDQFTSAVFEKDQEVKLSTIINYKRQVRDEVLAFEVT